MRKTLLLLAIAVFCISCTPAKVTRQDIQATAETLDYGDSTSATLVSKPRAERLIQRPVVSLLLCLVPALHLATRGGRPFFDLMTSSDSNHLKTPLWRNLYKMQLQRKFFS